MQKKKRIIVSVTNDLVIDQRVHKVCLFLHENNFDVLLVGRMLPTSANVNREYKTKRLKLLFKKGLLFYAFFNLRLFLFLLFNKADVLLSNDLDTLLPNYLVSKLRQSKLVYDSHEYFTEVPELNERPRVKSVWEKLEKWIFPKLKFVYTVNSSLAQMFSDKYKVKVETVQNVPLYRTNVPTQKNEKFTVLYQGALNKDRGLEELICAFKFVEEAQLWIIGGGYIENDLQTLIRKENLESKIQFFGKLPFEKLNKLTSKAHLGVSLEKATNLNYHFASPNKLFDYISNHLPVLTCSLPEIKNIVEKYNVGIVLEDITPELISEKINWAIKNDDKLKEWVENTKFAAKELCWENEIKVLKKIYLD